jgi:hypothetical protein
MVISGMKNVDDQKNKDRGSSKFKVVFCTYVT